MPDDWELKLTQLIRTVVREEISNHNHDCRFDCEDQDVKEFGKFMGVIQVLGDGKMGNGVEVIRENHKWLYKQRERSDKLASAFVFVLMTTLLTGVTTAIWLGIKSLLGR